MDGLHPERERASPQGTRICLLEDIYKSDILKPKAQLTHGRTFGPWEPPIARAERTAAGGPNRRQPASQKTNVKKWRSKAVDPSGTFCSLPTMNAGRLNMSTVLCLFLFLSFYFSTLILVKPSLRLQHLF